MDDFEKVSELVEKTGAGYEEAKAALDACGGDMLSAAIMLEKGHSHSSTKNYGRNNGGMNMYIDNETKQKLRMNGRKAAGCARNFFDKLCRNTLKITGSKEYFSIPLIAAVLISLFLIEIIVPAVLISIFCGISYVFTGPDFAENFVFGIKKPEKKVSYVITPERNNQENYEQPDYSYASNEDKGFFN